MMTLISLAISVAFVFSAVVTLGYPGMPLGEELATLVTIMLLGHWIEMRSISQAQGARRALAKLLPDTPVRGVGRRTEGVASAQRRNGDRLLVRPRARIPRHGDTALAVQRVVNVVVIACPDALGLAIPLVVGISTTEAAQSGLLVRNRRGLEEAGNLTAVVFDKTRTLTKGDFGVVDVAAT